MTAPSKLLAMSTMAIIHSLHTGELPIAEKSLILLHTKLGPGAVYLASQTMAETLLNWCGARTYLDAAPDWEHATGFTTKGWEAPEGMQDAYEKATAFLVAQANYDFTTQQQVFTQVWAARIVPEVINVLGFFMSGYLSKPLSGTSADPDGVHALIGSMAKRRA